MNRDPQTDAQSMERRQFLLITGAAIGLILDACSGSNTKHLPRDTVPVSVTAEATTNSTQVEIASTTVPTSSDTLSTSKPPETTNTLAPTQEKLTETFLIRAAETLLDLHEENQGGWRFKSEIQAPHYHTDRDVGAASVGMGFLGLVDEYPNDTRWLDAATKTATWLQAVSIDDGNGGRYWPDYSDDGDTSDTAFDSFDDGALGIGDFFWQLYEKTSDAQHKATALASLEWTLSKAEIVESGYRWKWNVNDSKPSYHMGMGEGMVGMVHTLATYYERTVKTDPDVAAKCKQYIDGAVSYFSKVSKDLGDNGGDSRALPETGVIGQDGDTTMDSGYLSGSAGEAFMYLKLNQVFGDPKYQAEADKLFAWLGDAESGPVVDFGDGSAAWKLMLDPRSPNNPVFATGMEEGNAGIGWTYLQAYELTANPKYLDIAKKSANWLLKVAIKDEAGGMSWHEAENGLEIDPNNPASTIVHPNLNNGAAGIGMFLEDIYQVTQDPSFKAGSDGALRWLTTTAVREGKTIYWDDNDKGKPFTKDPSWHWGISGIISLYQRKLGGKRDVPGEQSSLK